MILTDYYKLERLPETKSKTRLDCTASSQSYPEFEAMRNKLHELFMYFGDVPENFKADVKRRADKALTKGKNISSVFIPNIAVPFGFGDIINTNDALLFVFNTDFSQIELFVARGQRNNSRALYYLLTDGELNDEMEILRKQSGTEMGTI
jgi:hypothetical protein